jgi:hypothetical protein
LRQPSSSGWRPLTTRLDCARSTGSGFGRLDEVEKREDAVLFAATGQPLAARPPELLDELAELETRGARRVPGQARAVAAFIENAEPGVGVWIFRGSPGRVRLAASRLAALEGVEAVRISPTLLVVCSSTAEDPRTLVRQSVGIRRAWSTRAPADRENDRLRRVEEKALATGDEAGAAPVPLPTGQPAPGVEPARRTTARA